MKDAKKNIDPRAESLLLRAHGQWHAGRLVSAFRLLVAAAKLGDDCAQQTLGYFYDLGIGIKPNRAAAMLWYERAYRQGNSGGANNIGTIYRDETDMKRAVIWFERAAELGNIDANLEIAKVHLGENDQSPKALPYLRRVLKAKPGVDVTIDSYEQAQRLLKKRRARRR